MSDADSERPDGTFNILTMDGGPAALLQIRLLARLEKEAPGFLAATDVFAGSSNGSMHLFFLASRLPLGPLAPGYANAVLADAIHFSNSVIAAFHANVAGALRLLSGFGPLLLDHRLRDTLEAAFGDMTLGQVERLVLAASFNMNTWTPRVFRNFGPAEIGASHQKVMFGHESDGAIPVINAVLASGSLPLNISTFGNAQGHHYLDGAIIANNPALLAFGSVLQASDARLRDNAGPVTAKELCRVRLLSLGICDDADEEAKALQGFQGGFWAWLSRATGISPDSPGSLPWGWGQSIVRRPILLADLLYQGQNSIVAAECAMLLGAENQHRYAPSGAAFQSALLVMVGDTTSVIRGLDAAAETAVQRPEWAMLVDFVKTRWIPTRRPQTATIKLKL